MRAALGSAKPSDALPAAEKLVAAVEGAKDPNVRVMRIQTSELIGALKAASKAPTDPADLAARDRATANPASAVRAWQEAAGSFEKNTCN